MVDVLRKTIRPHNKEVLTNVVKAQASTIKRSQITVAGQYRWHRMVDKAYEILRTRNQGALPDGRTFGEVIENFVLGGDETCFLASGGDVRILGDKKKKKHEKATANSRTSTTIYRVGSAAGMTGPTAFLPPGVAKPTSTCAAAVRRSRRRHYRHHHYRHLRQRRCPPFHRGLRLSCRCRWLMSSAAATPSSAATTTSRGAASAAAHTHTHTSSPPRRDTEEARLYRRVPREAWRVCRNVHRSSPLPPLIFKPMSRKLVRPCHRSPSSHHPHTPSNPSPPPPLLPSYPPTLPPLPSPLHGDAYTCRPSRASLWHATPIFLIVASLTPAAPLLHPSSTLPLPSLPPPLLQLRFDHHHDPNWVHD